MLLRVCEGDGVLFSQNVIQILGAGAAPRMGYQIFVTGTERFGIEKNLIQKNADIPSVSLVYICQSENRFQEQIWAIIGISALISERQWPEYRFLLCFIEKEAKADGQFLIFVEEKVLQVHFLQQAVATAKIAHQFHQIHQKISDLELAQTLPPAHQSLGTPFIPLRNNKHRLSFIDYLQNRSHDFGVEGAIECENASEMLREGIDL